MTQDRGRYWARTQARYTGPDGQEYTARRPDGGPLTFGTKGDADAWLNLRSAEVTHHAWRPPSAPKPAAPITLTEYATAWLADRDLEMRTREHYQQLFDDHIAPTFGDRAVASLRPPEVRTWYTALDKTTGKTARSHAYQLLRTMCHTAVGDELLAANPCRIKGGGATKRKVQIKPATLAELEAVVTAMPPKYRLMTLFAAWLALRFGELAELRRGDIDVAAGTVHIRRGVVRTKSGRVVKDPKSEAGKRTVAIPPHLLPAVKDHHRGHAQAGRNGLLFPAQHGEQLAPSTLYKVYYPARAKAKRTDLRFHDLRNVGRDHRRDARGADGPTRSFHPGRGAPLLARGPGSRPGDRGRALGTRHGQRGRAAGEAGSGRRLASRPRSATAARRAAPSRRPGSSGGDPTAGCVPA